MGIVQKRADELKIGDVVVLENGRGVITQVDKDGYSWVAHSGQPYAPLTNLKFLNSVDVESPDLTPAQQHAEELADALRVLMDCHDSGAELYNDYHAKYTALLDKIKPPEPPTLAEALEALQTLHASTHPGSEPRWSYDTEASVRALLDRARRAGVLK